MKITNVCNACESSAETSCEPGQAAQAVRLLDDLHDSLHPDCAEAVKRKLAAVKPELEAQLADLSASADQAAAEHLALSSDLHVPKSSVCDLCQYTEDSVVHHGQNIKGYHPFFQQEG